MKLAAELAEKQQQQARLEAEKANEAMTKEAEARRLAQNLADKRGRDAEFAQQKLNELEQAEAEVSPTHQLHH